MQAIPIRLEPGDDLKLQIDRLAWGRGWRAACVLSCAGSLSNAEIRFADQADIAHVAGPLEIISLNGTVASFGGSHLHIAVANTKGQVLGGHLKEAASSALRQRSSLACSMGMSSTARSTPRRVMPNW